MKYIVWVGVFLYIGGHEPLQASADGAHGIPLKFGGKIALGGVTFGGEETDLHTLKFGYTLGGFARIRLGKWFALQPEFRYVSKGSQAKASDGTVFGIWSLKYTEFPLHGIGQLPRIGLLHPYVLLGPSLGIMLGSEVEGNGDRRNLKEFTNRVGLGMDLGIGAIIDVMPSWALSVEARYDLGLTEIFSTDTGRKSRAVVLGVGFSWTRNRDTDRDGIPNSVDRCWREAEDYDGFQDSDGCPDLDNDSDGIPDDEDKCPDEAEDMDGFQDQDGCPDPDNDGDGVLDVDDECPDKPFARTANGCPPVYATITVTVAKIELKRPVLFAKGKAEFDERTRLVLDEIATALTEHYPDRRVRIEGHADGEGSTKDNERLSQQRADAIRTYLIAKGAAEHRLVGKGYGESQPLHHEDTAEAEAKNRRVEFVFITE
jgi:outer membrane protein OmpA-like peptidoglycan-associated protein